MTAQAVALIVNKNGILLQKRDHTKGIKYPGWIGSFGGGIEEGETPLQAAIREIGEEILDYKPNKVIELGSEIIDGNEYHIFMIPDPDFVLENYKVMEGESGFWATPENLGNKNIVPFVRAWCERIFLKELEAHKIHNILK